jgi:hypothetical protein
MARKKVSCDPQIALLVSRYLALQNNSTAKKELEASQKRAQSWRYDQEPAFPDNPTVLHEPTWLDKQKRGTFRHGFDKAGDLVLIEWMLTVAIRKSVDYLQASFINVFGTRHKAEVVRTFISTRTADRSEC